MNNKEKSSVFTEFFLYFLFKTSENKNIFILILLLVGNNR